MDAADGFPVNAHLPRFDQGIFLQSLNGFFQELTSILLLEPAKVVKRRFL